jgi:peptidoglycan/xylan/chitin deacetylase (PgdA/CDA1 family)
MTLESQCRDGRLLESSAPVPILMYHSVSDDPPATMRDWSVTPTSFAAQLAHLRHNGFTGLTFGELFERRRTGQAMPARPVVLTFDDGYADGLEDALPIMRRYGFNATIFVTTGWVSDAGPLAAGAPPGRMLAWRQIAELSDAGIEIGAHAHSHPQLDQLSEAKLRSELTVPKDLLEQRLGRPIPSIAYPYGYSSKKVRNLAHEVGYLQAAAVANAVAMPDCDPFQVPRLTVRRSTTLTSFGRVVNQQWIPVHYAPTRALTAGWMAVRRGRYALNRLRDR